MEKIKALWARVPAPLKPVIHTVWQVAVGVFLQALFAARSPADVRAAFLAGGTAGAAALKAALLTLLL